MNKLGPIEKVYEAWTAIVDGRVKLYDDYATVTSSDNTKKYTIRFNGDWYSSDDNATYWRGYAGYPVIAVLMLQGRVPFDREEAEKWSDVNWKDINTRFKNHYDEAVKEISDKRGIDMKIAAAKAREVMEKLSELPIVIKRKI